MASFLRPTLCHFPLSKVICIHLAVRKLDLRSGKQSLLHTYVF